MTTKKIESLTQEQQGRFQEFVDKWITIGTDTRPSDRKRAEQAAKMCYQAAGLSPPSEIVWCRSPHEILESVVEDYKEVRHSLVVKGEVQENDTEWPKEMKKSDFINHMAFGQHDAGWLSFCDFFRTVCGLTEETEKVQGLHEMALSSGWWLPLSDICYLSERSHILNRDSVGRLHCEDGPALSFQDGYSIYSWHGVTVSKEIIMFPGAITVQDIDKEINSEIQRVMIERMGMGEYLTKSGAQIVDKSSFGILYKKEMPNRDPILSVRVLNSTPEPSGTITGEEALKIYGSPPATVIGKAGPGMQNIIFRWWKKKYSDLRFKEYFLSVHPQLCPLLDNEQLGPPQKLTARNAVASTFGMTGNEYDPVMET
jgi:hypothetical protein